MFPLESRKFPVSLPLFILLFWNEAMVKLTGAGDGENIVILRLKIYILFCLGSKVAWISAILLSQTLPRKASESMSC